MAAKKTAKSTTKTTAKTKTKSSGLKFGSPEWQAKYGRGKKKSAK